MEKQDFIYEQILIAKMKTGDRSAFSSIFSYYYPNMVSFASTFTKDADTSEEIVQDVFVQLWESRETLVITSSLKSFLLKTIQNRCINWLKHLKVRDRYNHFMVENSNTADLDTENYILKTELEGKLEQALQKLPKEVADAFRMNRYECKKYHEIAVIQNVSVRTIEVRIGKALSLLRESLKEYLILLLTLVNCFYK